MPVRGLFPAKLQARIVLATVAFGLILGLALASADVLLSRNLPHQGDLAAQPTIAADKLRAAHDLMASDAVQLSRNEAVQNLLSPLAAEVIVPKDQPEGRDRLILTPNDVESGFIIIRADYPGVIGPVAEGTPLNVSTKEDVLVSRGKLPQGAGSLWWMVLVDMVIILIATAVAAFTVHRLLRPLGDLVLAVQAGRIDDLPSRYGPSTPEEVRRLAISFSTLADQISEQMSRASAILENVPDGIVKVTPDGTICLANSAMGRMFGYRPDELVGQPLNRLMPGLFPAEQGHHLNTAALINRAPPSRNRNVTGLRRDGGTFPVGITLGHFIVSGELRFVGVVSDITERRQAEQRTEAVLQALRRSNEELDGFAYVASHDLKAPLRVIDNASKWLEEDLAPFLTDDTRESLSLLRNRVRRMNRLLEDLLAHSRIGRCEVATTAVSGADLMQDVRDLAGLPAPFKLVVDPAIDAIHLPRMPIRNVLLNLITNAAKHHDRACGTIWVRLADLGESYEFAVEDDGPGIAPEFHQKVFGMFQTLRPRDEVEGSGMGLAMVRKNIEVMGGTITLHSDGRRGSLFRFTWPKQPEAARMRDFAA